MKTKLNKVMEPINPMLKYLFIAIMLCGSSFAAVYETFPGFEDTGF